MSSEKKPKRSFRRKLLMPLLQTDRQLLPPSKNTSYLAFIDTAGGAGGDSATLAIGHVEQHDDDETPQKFVLDAVVETKAPVRS